LDRISPTERPAEETIGYQSWRELLFLHWAVDPEEIQRRIPGSLSVDTFDGRAYVGLVPFAMRHVRPRSVPAALGLNFLESNVRTYVHHRGDRPGVYFFSLDAASRIAVTVARFRWSLAYFHAQMTLEIERDGARRYAAQRSKAPHPTLDVSYRPGRALGASQPGTLEHFLLERYLLYVEHRRQLHVGQVHHTPYPVHEVEVLNLSDRFVSVAGIPVAGEPDTTHYAPGVDVEIFPLRKI